MKTFFNKSNRSVTYEFPLTGEAIGDGPGQPTLNLRVTHYGSQKALVANVSYIEKDFGPGYAIDKWQSDWPLIRIATKPTARYSEKALKEFAAEALTLLTACDNAVVAGLVSRISSEEVAA